MQHNSVNSQLLRLKESVIAAHVDWCIAADARSLFSIVQHVPHLEACRTRLQSFQNDLSDSPELALSASRHSYGESYGVKTAPATAH